MRISDWSSDVCSSDLGDELGPLLAAPPWDREPHSFWMRKKIVALIRAHRWNPENFSDPITALLEDLEEKAQSRKFVTSEYLQLREYMLEKKNEFRQLAEEGPANLDRKSTRLNSSH